MKSNIAELKKCANCGACVNICPVNAITVDKTGLFYQPIVDEDKCIHCHACVNVCPIENPDDTYTPVAAWWGRHRQDDILRHSSSGGVFTAIAEYVLAHQGIVFGACFDEDCQTVRIRSSQEVSLDDLRRSKYVESLTGDTFRQVKGALRQKQMVLFCGTPCQIAGLKHYLGGPDENLITCDFACGGLSSHGLYQTHLTSLEKKYGAIAKNVNFRPKVLGWSCYAIKIEFANHKTYIKPALLDPYMAGFLRKNVNTREYCYECRFAEHHEADLTLADFWKYSALINRPNDEKGWSLILSNTAEGTQLMEKIRDSFDMQELSLPEASYNIQPRQPSERRMLLRKEYLEACRSKGLKPAARLIGYPRGIRLLREKFRYYRKGRKYKVK